MRGRAYLLADIIPEKISLTFILESRSGKAFLSTVKLLRGAQEKGLTLVLVLNPKQNILKLVKYKFVGFSLANGDQRQVVA